MKKTVSALCAAAMLGTMLAGCGGSWLRRFCFYGREHFCSCLH